MNTDLEIEYNKYVIENSYINESGRLVVPALWDHKVIHRLPRNFNLAKSVLKSVFKKYKNDKEKIFQYNRVIQDQLDAGVTERVDDPEILENVSYMPHNAVFRENTETTKCRVVFLSNLCEKQSPLNLSHNQVSLPGCDLNNKLPVTATLYRFNKFIFIFDLEKAFLQLCLRPEDTDKLLFLWYDDINSISRKLVTYRFLRVPFGLRFSPYLLLISLFIILILNVDGGENLNLRQMLYNLSYMDNLAFSCGTEDELLVAYEESRKIFNKFKFNLQQYATNSPILHGNLVETPESEVKLFGMQWNSIQDSYDTKKLFLDPGATTKRKILSSLNSNFDPLGIYLPLFNRAKLFLRSLQAGDLDWDSVLSSEDLHEYRKICKQINKYKPFPLSRFIGEYNQNYDILVCTDASKDFFGCVLYLKCIETGVTSYLLAKNRVVPLKSSDSIPVLELLAVKFGLETMCTFSSELSNAFCPIKINNFHCFSDSTIALRWIEAKSAKTLKIERKGSKINNALDKIMNMCEDNKVNFEHISGLNNPADLVSRMVSSRTLEMSNYRLGPDILRDSVYHFTIPTPLSSHVNLIDSVSHYQEACIVDPAGFSSFGKLCRVVHYARKFCSLLLNLGDRNFLLTANCLVSFYIKNL